MAETMLEYWYQALNSIAGIRVFSNNRERLKHDLYLARRQANDPALAALSLTPSPIAEDEIWLYKKIIHFPGEPDEEN